MCVTVSQSPIRNDCARSQCVTLAKPLWTEGKISGQVRVAPIASPHFLGILPYLLLLAFFLLIYSQPSVYLQHCI